MKARITLKKGIDYPELCRVDTSEAVMYDLTNVESIEVLEDDA